MANNPNPQEFNRDVDISKAEDLTDYPKQYKAKETAHKVFPDQVAKADPNNVTAAAGPGPASKHLVHVSPEIRDRKNAILMDTAGRVALAAAQSGDVLYRQHINSEIENELDAIAQESVFGETDLVIPSGATPPELLDADARLDQITKAYQAGKIRESAYLVKMADAAQKLKQKFGITQGYGQVVDDMIRKHAGFDPANRLREHLISESEKARAKAEAAAASAKNIEKDTFERNMVYNRGAVPADVRADPEAFNNPEGWAYVNREVAKRDAILYDGKIATEQHKQGEISGEQALGKQIAVFGLRMEDIYKQAGLNMDQDVASIRRTNLRIADPNIKVNAEEANQQAFLMSRLHEITQMAATQALNELGPNIKPTHRDAFMQTVKNQTDMMASAMSGKSSYEAVGLALDISKSQVSQLMQNSPGQAAAHSLATKEQLEALAGTPGYDQMATDHQRALLNNLIEISRGTTTFDQALAEADPQGKGALINGFIGPIQDVEGLSKDDRAKRVKALFARTPAQGLRGEQTNEEIRVAKSDPQSQFFQKVATAEFAQAVQSTDDPEALQAYLVFLMDQYKYYNEQNVNKARLSKRDRPRINVELDPENLMFNIVERTSAEGRRELTWNPALVGPEMLWESYQENAARSAIEELNKHTQAVHGALSAIGVDSKPMIKKWWTGLGWSEEIEFEPSLGSALGDFVRNAVVSAFSSSDGDDKKKE